MEPQLLVELAIQRRRCKPPAQRHVEAMRCQRISGLLEDQPDTCRQPLPRLLFVREALLSCLGEPVDPRAPVVLRCAPVGGDPALLFEALEGGIERALLYLQNLLRELPDPLGDRPAMQRLERDVSYGARLLTRAPAFSLSAIALVALGIGSDSSSRLPRRSWLSQCWRATCRRGAPPRSIPR